MERSAMRERLFCLGRQSRIARCALHPGYDWRRIQQALVNQ